MVHTHIIAEVVLLHLYSTELETALSPTFIHTNQLTFQQRESLNSSLESIKSWFDVFFTITPAAYSGFSFSITSQLIRCLVTLCKLKTLDDPSWEESDVWKTMDPLQILDRVIDNLEQVAILAGLDNSNNPEGDAFSRGAQMFRSFRLGWEARLSPNGLSNVSVSQIFNETVPPDTFAGDFFNSDDWLMDFLLSPNF